MPEASSELELLAAIVHGATAALHAEAVRKGRMTPRETGAAIALHSLAIVYNARRGQWVDVAAHVTGAAAALSEHRGAHAAVAIYDGAAAFKHARCARGVA